MGAFMYFEIFGPGEHLAASLERAWERFLARMHPDMVDQLVLGLKRPPLALASVPETRVRCALGPADVLDRDVRHDVLHRAEHLAARAHRRRPGLVDPQARHVLERGGRGGRHRATWYVPVKTAAREIAAAASAGAVLVLDGAAAVVRVPVHRHGRVRRLQWRRWRGRRVRLVVRVVMVMVQLQVVVNGRVQTAQMVVRYGYGGSGAVLVMVMAVVIVGHVPADLQKVSVIARMVWRMRRRRWRLPVVHVMVLVLRRSHVIVLDLDAHAVGQRRVVHKRV